MVADSLELLPEYDEVQGKTFSTAEWYTERKRWVFLTSSADYREKLLPLHSVWLDLFILRMMGHCEDHEAKPVWFVLDELASLNKLPQLHTAVTENRKYGNPVVLGFQGRSQLEKRYGRDAEAMLSQPATKIFFKTSEPRAAKWISEAIGEVEVERLKESRNLGPIGQQEIVCLGDHGEAARHGLRDFRTRAVTRLHQTREPRRPSPVSADKKAQQAARDCRAQDACDCAEATRSEGDSGERNSGAIAAR
jgi:hypothetical protein